MHNLHVAGEHTYYVTAGPVQADQLVHNASWCSLGDRAAAGWMANYRAARASGARVCTRVGFGEVWVRHDAPDDQWVRR